jgi:hypothetical protein
MNNSPLSKVHVVRSAAQMFATEIYLTRFINGQAHNVKGSYELQPFNKVAYHAEPAIRFEDDTDVQQLMDELWKAGFRPSTEHHGTIGQLAATEKHLMDMRAIAFHACNLTAP